MPSLWMLAQWSYPGHLNTQGLPLVIVNQIMMPWLHCIVISVIQPFQHCFLQWRTRKPLCLYLFFWMVTPELVNMHPICLTHVFSTFFPLSQGSVRQTWYVVRADEYIRQYSPQGRLNSPTVFAFCRWQSAMPSTPCSITPRINWMLWKR